MNCFAHKITVFVLVLLAGGIGNGAVVLAEPMSNGFYHMEDYDKAKKGTVRPALNAKQATKEDLLPSEEAPSQFQAPDILVDGKKCFWKSLDFTKAFYKKNRQGQEILQIEGVKSYKNMKVMLFPVMDDQAVKTAHIYVVGCLPGDQGEFEQGAYTVTMLVQNFARQESLTIVGRTKTKRF